MSSPGGLGSTGSKETIKTVKFVFKHFFQFLTERCCCGHVGGVLLAQGVRVDVPLANDVQGAHVATEDEGALLLFAEVDLDHSTVLGFDSLVQLWIGESCAKINFSLCRSQLVLKETFVLVLTNFQRYYFSIKIEIFEDLL